MTTPDRASRPGGRTARVRAQVLAAVEAELTDHGFDGLSIDGVAARSGVHRATVYRRWKTVAGLIVDLLRAGLDDDWSPADTGTLAGDLTALNQELYDALTMQPSIAQAVIAASFRSPEAAEALTEFWRDRYARSAELVTRAVGRGEVTPDIDAEQLLVAATAPLFHQLVLLRRPITAEEAIRYAHLAAVSVQV